MNGIKFNSADDAILFAIEERLAPITELLAMDKPQLESICEGVAISKIMERDERKHKLIDREKSRLMEKKWVHKRKSFMKGIKRFNKSIRGRRAHAKAAQMRKNGTTNIHESYVDINSIITHLAIHASFNSNINEEAQKHLLFLEGVRILSPVLNDIVEGKVNDINERLAQDDSGLFIDDLLFINEENSTADNSPGELNAEEILTDKDVATQLARDPSALPNEPEGGRKSEGVQGDEVTEALNDQTPERLVDIVESYQGESDLGDQFEMITEANDPDVDGEHVIAKIIGPAFFPDTVSRNRVEYSRELWETVLSKPHVQAEMKARRLFGTFGHTQKIDDTALLDGKISHITSKAYINEDGIGIGEYLVLNTEPGRNLKTYMGAKAKLRVSTRCRGTYLTKCNARGNAVPNPATFDFKGIDFVYDPGYLGAEPRLA